MFEHIGLQELWLDFGTGKAHIHKTVYTIVQNVCPETSLPCHYFITSRGAIPHIRPWRLVKRLHGQHGTHSLTSQKLC